LVRRAKHPLSLTKIQHLNLVILVPYKSFTTVLSTLGGRGVEMAIDRKCCFLLWESKNYKERENAQNDLFEFLWVHFSLEAAR
jgi:hypothetical protein